ncbi:MAG TPA: hypothetical protein DCZ91_20405, partial [Lachnospiraceae bacterium]|nr:hypothetical protein [Lachnospiraceae bacterium]
YKYEQIILIRSRLATQYLDKNLLVEYMGADAIKKKNTIINKMEDFFLEQMDNKVHVYTYPFDVYSDKSFRMGAEPQYYADSFYRKMSVQISASLY